MDGTNRKIYTAPMCPEDELVTLLRKYWGYETFRPMQREIIRSIADGHDTCAVMPTGGGKSLCYQLPAILQQDRTAVVISPLIALMQDQVAQLKQMGIPSAFLNSSLPREAQSVVMRQAELNHYRLLYLSPERLALGESLDWLSKLPVSFFVIDEAHCISEWGHEFRPDYRHLNKLRVRFLGNPIAAFTASATQRVRHDIIDQLKLREPRKYIASFHRPNLRYLVRECDSQAQERLLLKALHHHSTGSIIVYAPTIARVEETAAMLNSSGIPALAYHGKMHPVTRRESQERWMSDEVRVLVGTLAFGLGINKASVRAVIHLALPKSLEQYYQEAGRAGRDGLPADCLLLWQPADVGLLSYFTRQIADPLERDLSWQRYHDIVDYAESGECHHRRVCRHFGESVKWTNCGACDVCAGEPLWMLSSRERKLTEERPPRREISIKRLSRPSKSRRERTTSPHFGETSVQTDLVGDSEILRNALRAWRKETARVQGVPAFVVLHDATLDQICRRQPRTIDDLLCVPGIGERKAEVYGPQILKVVSETDKS